nr:UDP-glucose/GDP-mannose dehydrogenase family protein [Oceanococcus sp. HetDA_MAG_MS8]
MKVTVFGTGYVGLVSGTCLAEMGHDVICVDVDEAKVDGLNRGEIPIHEPGLEPMVLRNRERKSLRFTTDAAAAVEFGKVIFIAVGTPPDEDGSADLQYVLAVARTIGEHMSEHKFVVDKSTVPVGTADKVRAALSEALAQRGADLPFDVISNPEFLKEGAAIEDFMKPDRIVVGTESEEATAAMHQLYAAFARQHEKLIVMDVRSAELTKYAANALLATKISFMNEMANLAERLGADVDAVRRGIGSDPRIGYKFIFPGCGYGGSCFPKDVQALERTADSVDYPARILAAVEATNAEQKHTLFRKLSAHFKGDLANKTIAVWGLAFKPNTDDMREAPSRTLMESVWEAGGRVQAYDPASMNETRRIYGTRQDLVLAASAGDALAGADALVICTEWSEFRTPNYPLMAKALKTGVIVDGRNLWNPKEVAAQGFDYYCIGRPHFPAAKAQSA